MSALQTLEEIRVLDTLIDAKIAERQRLLDIATDMSPKPPDGMPFDNTGTVSQKMQNAVVSLIDLARETDKLVDEYIDKRQKVLDLMTALPSLEFAVLHRHYIRRMTWEKVAEDMGYSTMQIYRIKKRALKILEDVIECYAKNE